MEKPAVALDARLTRQMSIGMKAYASELAARLPLAAPDLRFIPFTHGANFTFDEQVRLPFTIARSGASLTHYLSLYAPLLAPRPYVVTVHDLIHLRFARYFKRHIGPYYRTAVRRLCARAAFVITDDERTAGDLQTYLRIDPAKVRVIALGAADVFFAPAPPHAPDRPYILYAGNRREHKDLPTLLHAWAALPAGIDVDLYLTGHDDVVSAGGERFARTNGRIVALGDISEPELASYYAGASALVHPALCEGFGLPMLEAMAQGCPVIACQDAVPGVLRKAVLTFPARDWRGASAAIERVLQDAALQHELRARGRAHAAPYTWDRCARETAQVYRDALQERAAC
ncbi:MAG: glycosyltransferase family 4 protein [Candidatus Baltobacteraceae bacterium]